MKNVVKDFALNRNRISFKVHTSVIFKEITVQNALGLEG